MCHIQKSGTQLEKCATAKKIGHRKMCQSQENVKVRKMCHRYKNVPHLEKKVTEKCVELKTWVTVKKLSNISLQCVINLANFRLLFNLLLFRSSTARVSGTSILSRWPIQKLRSKETLRKMRQKQKSGSQLKKCLTVK